jgi:hypothetical protein
MAKRLRRIREEIEDERTDFVEFPGVGHEVGGDEALVTTVVIPRSRTGWKAAWGPCGSRRERTPGAPASFTGR